MNPFEQKKNFNIDSTIINENYRVSTAAIFYEGEHVNNLNMEVK